METPHTHIIYAYRIPYINNNPKYIAYGGPVMGCHFNKSNCKLVHRSWSLTSQNQRITYAENTKSRTNRTTICAFIKTFSKIFNIKYADAKNIYVCAYGMSEYLMHRHVDDRKTKNNNLWVLWRQHRHNTQIPTHIHTHSHTHSYSTKVLISVLWSPSKSRKQRNYTQFCKYSTSFSPLSSLADTILILLLLLLLCCIMCLCNVNIILTCPRSPGIVNR